MDLYAIHKLVPAFGSGGSSSTTSPPPPSLIKSLSTFHNEREEFARFLNMMLAKTGQMMDPPTLKTYDINYDDDSEDMEVHRNAGGSSTDFNTDLLLTPFNSQNRLANSGGANGGSSVRATLADQFTWGAVVCAGVFIVVFVCVMAAWWVHKKQQDHIRRRTVESVESRMGMDAGPYCIENDAHGRSHGATSSGVAPHDIQQRPPSYFEVIGFFDPPPSYNDIQGTGQHPAYDNVAITIDELPPPFVEGDYLKSEVKSTDSETTSAINNSSESVIVQQQEGSSSC